MPKHNEMQVEVECRKEQVAAKCPKCDKKIDYIQAQTDATQKITANTEEPKWEIDHEWVTYACPGCCEAVVYSFDDAVKLMKGGK